MQYRLGGVDALDCNPIILQETGLTTAPVDGVFEHVPCVGGIPIIPPTQGKVDGEQVKSWGLDGLMLTLEAGKG